MLPKEFFDRVRADLFAGSLTQQQVNGCKTIVAAFEGCDPRWTAYALATAFHETARTMQPIHEMGGKEYLRRNYDITGSKPDRARRMGNVNPGDGVKYAGRGYVQLTWRVNYAKAGKALGLDLVNDPDRAMDPIPAAMILRKGMEEGWFTGKKLRDYFIGAKADWTGARRIINGTDKAELIAGYARKFYAALLASAPADLPTPPGKPQTVSTTQIAAGAAATATVVSQAKEAVAPIQEGAKVVNDFGEAIAGVANLSGWILALIAIAALVWIMRERWKKSREMGV